MLENSPWSSFGEVSARGLALIETSLLEILFGEVSALGLEVLEHSLLDLFWVRFPPWACKCSKTASWESFW